MVVLPIDLKIKIFEHLETLISEVGVIAHLALALLPSGDFNNANCNDFILLFLAICTNYKNKRNIRHSKQQGTHFTII